MITVKAYKERQYYLSKYGEKCFIDTDDSGVYLKAAMLTGKGLQTEEEFIYTAVGRNLNEAQDSLNLYLQSINEDINGLVIKIEGKDEIQDDSLSNKIIL